MNVIPPSTKPAADPFVEPGCLLNLFLVGAAWPELDALPLEVSYDGHAVDAEVLGQVLIPIHPRDGIAVDEEASEQDAATGHPEQLMECHGSKAVP